MGGETALLTKGKKMKVIAKQDGFYGGKLVKEGQGFTLHSRLDEKETKAKHKEDIEKQFSSKWMAKDGE